MDIFEKLQVKKFINAHDTYTVYGGSRMSVETIKAMNEVSKHFVNIDQLQEVLGVEIARLTNNQAAYITNGAAGALQLCAAVCMSEGNIAKYYKLPDIQDIKNQCIMLKCQRNAYDKAVLSTGMEVVEAGDADETFEWDIENKINERTSAIFYFPSELYKRGSLQLEDVIKVAHRNNIPVVVDAAAQLPPASNLWYHTKLGADMVIFSGGKTLCGPQDSGVILGKRKYIDWCKKFGAPKHGICRSSKTSRESMVGLYVAIKQYVKANHEENKKLYYKRLQLIQDKLSNIKNITFSINENGPVGQDYPRLFIKLPSCICAQEVTNKALSRKVGIYLGLDSDTNSIYISPLNINLAEAEEVALAVKEYIGK